MKTTAHLVSGTTAAPGPDGRIFKAAEPFQLAVVTPSPSHALELAEQELQRQYAVATHGSRRLWIINATVVRLDAIIPEPTKLDADGKPMETTA